MKKESSIEKIVEIHQRHLQEMIIDPIVLVEKIIVAVIVDRKKSLVEIKIDDDHVHDRIVVHPDVRNIHVVHLDHDHAVTIDDAANVLDHVRAHRVVIVTIVVLRHRRKNIIVIDINQDHRGIPPQIPNRMVVETIIIDIENLTIIQIQVQLKKTMISIRVVTMMMMMKIPHVYWKIFNEV